VLVVVVDTLRADHLSTYGYSRLTSPHVDQFAQHGVLFENAIAASSWTLPSHASMLTGHYAAVHRADRMRPMSVITHSGEPLQERFFLLGEALEPHGYRTAAFSGNRVFFSHYLGFAQGFTHFEDFLAMDMLPRTVLGRRFAELALYHNRVRSLLVRMGFRSVAHMQIVSDKGLRRRGSEINHSALSWIDRDHTRPFFVFMNYFDVHGPYRPAYSVGEKFSHGNNNGIDHYDDGVADVDGYFGDLLHELDRRGLTENTFIIFTSDHGELLKEHGLEGHGNALYRELIHVPYIISKPGTIPAGLRIDTPISTSALPSTVMDLMGWGKPALFPGPSLAELWKHPGPHPDWPYPASELAQFPNPDDEEGPSRLGSSRSVVTAKWHYIFHEKLGELLYDWKTDLAETKNLAKENPDDVAAARQALSRELQVDNHPE
jgi:arylsulfatase A-like enzyme